MGFKKRYSSLPVKLIFLCVTLCLFSQNSYSEKLDSIKNQEIKSHSHSHNVLLNKSPIGKPSASISFEYDLPEAVVVGEELSLSVFFDSKQRVKGAFLIQLDGDQGVNINSSTLLSLEYLGTKVSSEIVFKIESEGLYYLNFGVLQLDENGQRIQARSFVIPIQAGQNEQMGEISVLQNKVNTQLPNSKNGTASGRKIIEMIAE